MIKIRKEIFIGPLAILVIWQIVSMLKLVNPFFLPSPIATITELFRIIFTGIIIKDLVATVLRVVVALVIAIILGLPLGLLLGSSRKTYEKFEIVIDLFRSIPATAMFPLFLLIFGIDDKSKVAVAAFSGALIILFNTAYGVMHSKKIRVLAAQLMGATKVQIFKYISFWESLPQTFIGIRTAVSLSLVIIVVTEMFVGTYAGLGKVIVDSQYIYNVKGMYATILLTGLIGYFFNAIFIFIEKKVIHWTGK